MNPMNPMKSIVLSLVAFVTLSQGKPEKIVINDTIQKSAKTPKTTKSQKSQKSQKSLIKTAKKYLGIKYKYGGTTTRGLDCSAFVQKVFKKHGKNLPRTSRQQIKIGKTISKKKLKSGDLVFFGNKKINHVGIFLGNGRFIHASSGAKKVTISKLNKKYYKQHYMGARRI